MREVKEYINKLGPNTYTVTGDGVKTMLFSVEVIMNNSQIKDYITKLMLKNMSQGDFDIRVYNNAFKKTSVKIQYIDRIHKRVTRPSMLRLLNQ